MAMKPRSAIKTDLFADEHHRKKIDSLGDPRAESESHIDFAAPAADVDRVAPRPASARGGRPPYPTETMVRILGLKRRYTLSDEQMEYPLLDRMSYKRFCGLAPATNIPDRTTAWTFENRIGEAGAKALIEQGAMPDDWQPAKRRQKDIEATWTKEPLWLQTVAQRRQEAQVHPHDRDRPGQHPRQPTLRSGLRRPPSAQSSLPRRFEARTGRHRRERRCLAGEIEPNSVAILKTRRIYADALREELRPCRGPGGRIGLDPEA